MFEHIRKKLPWRMREERLRKKKFIKKLQEPGFGQPKIRFKDETKIPIGTMILLQDYSDGSMLTAFYTGSGKWMIYGNSPSLNSVTTTMTTIGFEDFLTEKRNKATPKDKFLIFDENKLLNIDYSAHISNSMGLSKVAWYDIGNNEDE